jgi:hypothetical protein
MAAKQAGAGAEPAADAKAAAAAVPTDDAEAGAVNLSSRSGPRSQ